MDANSLKILLKNNIGMLFEPENYSSYIKQSIRIPGYDFMNRFLIFFQNRKATDVKNDIAWSDVGRALIESSKPIWVIIPIYKSVYVDLESGRELKQNELTITEITQALDFGIIQRQKSIVNFESTTIYDINDTKIIEASKAETYDNKIKKKNIKLSILCDLCTQTCGIKISGTNVATYYDKESNTLYVGKDTGLAKASAIIEILVTCMIERLNSNYELSTSELTSKTFNNKLELSEENRRFITESVLYAVYNYIGISNKYTFDYVKEIYGDMSSTEDSMNELVNKMNCIDYITYNILSKFNSRSADSTSKIMVIEKAERLLDIIEANNVMHIIKGGAIR